MVLDRGLQSCSRKVDDSIDGILLSFDFQSYVYNVGLLDIRQWGCKCAWINKEEDGYGIFSKMDEVLADCIWQTTYLNPQVIFLSNHCVPLLKKFQMLDLFLLTASTCKPFVRLLKLLQEGIGLSL